MNSSAPRAFVLMTAMPPTTGHQRLINYASNLAPTTVILGTQLGEPYLYERAHSVNAMAQKAGARFIHDARDKVQQEAEGPDDDDFWASWADFLRRAGFRPGDYFVASETYGIRMAQELDGVFMPFDMDRVLGPEKATKIRQNPTEYYNHIAPEFKPYIKKRVTIFGAESAGKTTLARALDKNFVFEWARPYLENVGSHLDREVMTNIWQGQEALQMTAFNDPNIGPVVYQDTDLYSTFFYWLLHEEDFGPVPDGLLSAAEWSKSDLYIIPRSNIPFEPDPLRYGGHQRETDDEYWISLAERYSLPYVVLDSDDRITEATAAIRSHLGSTFGLDYVREGSEYQ